VELAVRECKSTIYVVREFFQNQVKTEMPRRDKCVGVLRVCGEKQYGAAAQ
jgi:hypothetical protein